jgi:hypothetical protein
MDVMDANLVRYLLPFSKSQCNSLKHHQWAHYTHHRLQTGCTAKEYAFERSYAVGHKKQVNFTNKAKSKALQTPAKHWFRNGMQRLATRMGMTPEAGGMGQITPVQLESPVVPCADISWPSNAVKRVMEIKARAMHPALVRASSEMRVTVTNRLARRGDRDRRVSVLFRAKHEAKNKWVDNFRLHYTSAKGKPAIGFGKCLGFFANSVGHHFVAMQWYKICGRTPIDKVGRMCKVELVDVYDYVPAASILNGALIVPVAKPTHPGNAQQHWAIQSHREGEAISRLA